MKIVINSSDHGFDLSHEAKLRYAELTGTKLYFRINDFDYYEYFADEELTVGHYDIFWSGNNRTDPFLIQTISELGELANGEHSKLKIIEIPDGIEYGICSPDYGNEWVYEKHRTWE